MDKLKQKHWLLAALIPTLVAAVGYYIANSLYIDNEIGTNTYGLLIILSMIVCLVTILVSIIAIFKVKGTRKFVLLVCILVLAVVTGLNLLALFGISYANSH